MRRREFITLACGAVAAWPLTTRAQQSAMPVVGFLDPVPEAVVPHLFAAFRRGLADAGYVAGNNLAIEYRIFTPEVLPEAVADLVRRNVNVIFAAVPDAVAAATKVTISIPIVALDLESDPLAKGYVKSFARPGGNLTGMFLDLPELSGKQVGLLKEIVPQLSRIAIFGIPDLNAAQFAATKTALRALALEAEIMEVRVLDDFERAMDTARARHVQAGILLSSPLVFDTAEQLAGLALVKRLPCICLFAEFPKSGGLIAYGPNVSEMFRRCGEYVGKVLHGAKPSDLPIQRPEKFDLVINLKTAAALGVDVPSQLQQLADEVIE
jgi:putative ABC transport system substrate-binding protein